MRYAKLLSLGAAMALLVGACGGASLEAGGTPEGIQVHGDWTIDVYNEDGTLDQRVEFENALDLVGPLTISNLLTGTRTAGDFVITYFASGPSGATESFWNASAEVVDGTVVATAEGSIAEERDSIERVGTGLYLCGSDVAPDNCGVDGFAWGVTEKVLDQPVEVATGQTVQVEVVISFTSG